MWSIRSIVCVLYVISVAFALPATQKDSETGPSKPQPIILEAFELPSKPTNDKPSDAKPIDLIAIDLKPMPQDPFKPTEDGKPSEFGSAFPLQTPGKPPRRQLFYDQRQEGKYNIRADLENFVILVVPSSGNSLLDLLKRSSQRNQHTKRTHAGKHHKKYVSGSSSTAGKTAEAADKKSTIYSKPEGNSETASAGEFIEGRTPYHVDISSAEISQPSTFVVSNANNGIETELIVTPADIEATDATAQTTNTGNKQGKPILPEPTTTTTTTNTQIPRLSKSLSVDGYGNSISNSNLVLLTRKSSYRNDYADNAQQSIDDALQRQRNYNNYFSHRPSVQIVNSATDATNANDLTDTKHSFNSLNVGNVDRLALAGDDGTTKLVSDLANAQWELTLLGAEEQCGPDRRRDSYGICQFVPADYATLT